MKNLIVRTAGLIVMTLALFLVFTTGARADAPPAEWYLQYQPNMDVFNELKRGRVDFYVNKPTAVYYKVYYGQTVAYWEELIKGEVLPAGTPFHVDGLSAMYERFRLVRGYYGDMHIGGKSWLFPAESLSFEHIVDGKPNIPGKTDCTGHPLADDWFRTGKINWDIRLPKDADKMDVFLIEKYPLIDSVIFGAEQRRHCLVTLEKNTVVSMRGNVVDTDYVNQNTGLPDPSSGTRWVYVRLPGGMEGLLPTGKLSLTPVPDAPNVTKPAAAGATKSTTPITHLVQSGDTLWGVGIKYGVSVEELVAVNSKTYPSLTDAPGQIKPGWRIEIPKKQ